MGGSSKSSSKQSTSNTQTTTNTDNSLNASEQGTVIGGTGAQITINDLSADVAGKALDLGAEVVGGAFELSKQTTDRAFDSFDNSTKLLNEYATAQSVNLQYQALKNQELTAALATKSFDLADEKTQSADDKVFSFGKAALYVFGAILAIFAFAILFKKSPAKAD